MPRSINWSSPEILTDSDGIKESADIWSVIHYSVTHLIAHLYADHRSLVFVMCEVLTGEVPFDKQEIRTLGIEDLKQRLIEGLRPILPMVSIAY